MAQFFILVGVLLILGAGGCSLFGYVFLSSYGPIKNATEWAQVLGMILIPAIVPVGIGWLIISSARKSLAKKRYQKRTDL